MHQIQELFAVFALFLVAVVLGLAGYWLLFTGDLTVVRVVFGVAFFGFTALTLLVMHRQIQKILRG